MKKNATVPSEGHFVMLFNSALKYHWTIREHVTSFVLVPQIEMGEMRKRNRFKRSTTSFTFDITSKR